MITITLDIQGERPHDLVKYLVRGVLDEDEDIMISDSSDAERYELWISFESPKYNGIVDEFVSLSVEDGFVRFHYRSFYDEVEANHFAVVLDKFRGLEERLRRLYPDKNTDNISLKVGSIENDWKLS